MPESGPLLIAVTDLSRIEIELRTWADALFDGGVDLIHLRAPGVPVHDICRDAEILLNAAPSPDRVQINEHVDLAAELGCGIHLPEWLPPARPPLDPASRSVHSIESAKASDAFDFVIAGHVFATASKPGLPPRGTDWLRGIVVASRIPVVAIGGVTSDNASEVIALGAAGVAVIGALTTSSHPRNAAANLRNAIDSAWRNRNMQEQSTTIDITLNEKPATVPEGSTIHDLLATKELAERLVVVELNGVIVSRSAFGETLFSAGDQVEIVHFVGGGNHVDR